jgi:hypothetical protein
MSKRYLQHIKRESNVKVIAQVHKTDETNSVWFVTLAAAIFAAAFYFFSFFFGFTGGRVLIKG